MLSVIGINININVQVNWLNWFHLLTLVTGPLTILKGCMIFLSSFLDVKDVFVNSFFLAQLHSGFFCLQNAFL